MMTLTLLQRKLLLSKKGRQLKEIVLLKDMLKRRKRELKVLKPSRLKIRSQSRSRSSRKMLKLKIYQ